MSLAASGFAECGPRPFETIGRGPRRFELSLCRLQNPQSLLDLLLQLRFTPNREQQARACVRRGGHEVSLSRPVYFIALGGVDYDLDDKRSVSTKHFLAPH
jgi:hypothetical protein